MSAKPIAASKITAITTKVVALLQSLSPEDIEKVVRASLTLLGASAPPTSHDHAAQAETGKSVTPHVEGLSQKGHSWLKQNALSLEQVQDVLDITKDGVTVIASSIPGENTQEKAHNAYILRGLCQYLATGETAFDDESARKVCEDVEALNAANHAKYMNKRNSAFTGSKKAGWRLTTPGLRAAAELIKTLTAKPGK